MKIHYVINDWGHALPIYFDECCTAATVRYTPEAKPFNGFWFDNSNPRLLEMKGGQVLKQVDICPHCDAKTELIKRELKPIE